MKLLTQFTITLAFGLVLALIQACDSSDPIATQYKKENPGGPGVVPTEPDDNDNGDGDGDGNGDDNDNGNGSDGLALGDPEAGEVAYNENNCGTCHENGVSGAQPLIGTPWDSVEDFTQAFNQQADFHGGIALSEQDFQDLTAYFND